LRQDISCAFNGAAGAGKSKASAAIRLCVESLEAEQLGVFTTHGYLVLPEFLPGELVATLSQEVDRWVDEGWRADSLAYCRESVGHPVIMELELGEHGMLITHPPLMEILKQLLGPVFAFHHMHSDRHDPGREEKTWHHDYEQSPQTDRSHLMVHVFHYLNGLDGTIGDLVVLPGSHDIVAEKYILSGLGTMPLPDEVVIDSLPPGSTVIMHSALFHARRARLGGEGRRYFIDCAYCQGGVRWPSVKGYWRYMLARAVELGLDRGRWSDLFSERHFYDSPEVCR
jgi:hypothetical protein